MSSEMCMQWWMGMGPVASVLYLLLVGVGLGIGIAVLVMAWGKTIDTGDVRSRIRRFMKRSGL